MRMSFVTSHKLAIDALPSAVKSNVLGWSQKNDMQLSYFDDHDMDKYVWKHCSRPLCKAYGRLVTGAAKSDLFRTLYLFKEGGFWVDMDIANMNVTKECTFPPFMRELSLYKFPGVNRPRFDIIASLPKSRILKEVLDEAVRNVLNNESGKAINVTGPFVLQRVLCRLHDSSLCRAGKLGGSKSKLKPDVYGNFTYSECKWKVLSFSKRREWKRMKIKNWRFFRDG